MIFFEPLSVEVTMSNITNINYRRRQFLQYTAFGALTAALPGLVLGENRVLNNKPNSAFKADVEIDLIARLTEVAILSGKHTRVFQYHGKLIKGPQTALKTVPGYLGPIFSFQKGQKIRINFYNQLSELCITHWHGLHVPQIMDGHPMYAISHGERYVYEFEIKNPAGTNWYHSHTHELTGAQVYQGLAGMIIISDDVEQKLELPSGEYDLPIIIQDRNFTHDNQLSFNLRRHDRMRGFLGNLILVNGQVNSSIPVKTRAYRLRILNGSNARIYKLGWNDGTAITAIGTDGGLLEKPQNLPYVMLAPAERVELWVDFSGRKPGSELILQSLTYQGTHSTMGRGMMGNGSMRHEMGRMMDAMGSGFGQDEVIDIAKFQIHEQVGDSPKLPVELIPMRRLTERDVSQPDRTIPIAIGMQHMSFQLNDKTFAMQDYGESEKIPLNTIQRMKIFHDSHMMGGGMHGGRGGMMGMMMSMPHPIHVHGQQFQVLSRRQSNAEKGYESVKDGFIDSGWKDTILVMPGEEIDIIKPFNDYTGLFPYHCHILEHEDMGMMRNFYVS
jgi:suppressor of ftsI/bilirubin oxidase